jgi:subtilisin family serine protease
MKPVIVGALSLMMTTPFNVMAIGPQQQSTTQSKMFQEIHSKVIDQVKALGKQETVFIEESLDTKTINLLNVIVELKESTEQGIAPQSVEAQQTTFIQSLNNQGLNITVGRTFQKVFNGMSMTIPGNKISELAANPNVKAIYEDGVVTADPIYAEDMNDGVPFIGAYEMNNAGFKGEGMKVGVIDTGVDYYHPDLKDAYKGGYDLVDNDSDPYETLPNYHNTQTTHGTHVSGTIVGNNLSGNGVRGVAPEADLYVYRVLGPGGSGSDSNVIAGIEKSVEDDMDVINLSLGNSQQHDPFSPSSIAVNNAILAGVTVVLSNGNSGPGRYSVGSPASSDMAISVGATTLDSTRYVGDVSISYPDPTKSQTNTNQLDTSTNETDSTEKGSTEPTPTEPTPSDQTTNRGDTSSSDPSTNVENQTNIKSNFPVKVMAWDEKDGPEGFAKTLQGVPLVYVGIGTKADYKVDMKGKAVLISRGDITLNEKISNATKSGAVAAFIFDKDSKTLGPISFFPGAGDYVATYSLSEEAGVELLNAMKAQPEGELTLDFGAFQSYSVKGDEIAPFSSRGPSANNNIKPDVVAPGVNIRSTIAAYGADYTEAYQSMNGTSMAAPHVAGLSVLVRQAHPEYTPFDVKAALMNTSKVLETPKYTVFDQGAGRVQGVNALTTEALAMVKEQSKSNLNRDSQLDSAEHYTGSVLFGDIDPSSTEAILRKKTILLKDVVGKAQDYQVRYEITSPEMNGVTLTTPTEVHVDAEGETSFDVSINVPASTPHGEYQGNIYLTNVETGAVIHLPFVSFVGDPQGNDGFTNVELIQSNFSPDGDGKLDTIPVKFDLTKSAEVVFGELFDVRTGDYLGIAFGYVADAEHPALEPGEHVMEWDGTYLSGPDQMIASDGIYAIALVGFSKIPTSMEDTPFVKWVDSDLYLQTETPKVVIKEKDFIGETDTYHLTGRVEDLYSANGLGDKVKVMYSLRNIRSDVNLPERFDDGFFFVNPDGTFEVDIKVFSGYNIITFEATTPAFDFGPPAGWANQSYLHLRVGQPTQYLVAPNREIKLGEEFEVTVDARYVDNFVAGDLGFMIDESTMKFLGAEATEEINSIGDSSLVVKDLGIEMVEIPGVGPNLFPGGPGPGPIEPGVELELHSYKVGLALKGLKDGVDGNIPYVKLKFKATSNIEKVNQHLPIFVSDSTIVRVNAEGKEELAGETFALDGEVILYAPQQKIVGNVATIMPEAFEAGADYSKKGITVYASWGGYYHPYTNNYSNGQSVEGIVSPDGSFVIEGLPADQSFIVRLFVPGHLPAIMEGVQLLKYEEGFYVPGDVEVGWERNLLAGNVNSDNVIDLLDLAVVSRNFGSNNATAEQGDINLDGIVDILDLSFVTANYDTDNENSLGWGVIIPIPERPMNE